LAGKSNLVLVTHGWLPSELNANPFYPAPIIEPWVINLASNIQTHVTSDWQAVAFDWALDAWTGNPESALANAIVKGDALGKQIAAQHWQHIHLIAHSAGAALIQRVADIVRTNSPSTTIHTTFLDPYLGLSYSGIHLYGRNSDWSDNYYAHDSLTDDLGELIFKPNLTGGRLEHSHNVNVGWLDPKCQIFTNQIIDWATGGRLETHQEFSSHGWPYDFYSKTVLGTAGACAANYGFPLSKEGDGWMTHSAFTNNNEPNSLCGLTDVVIQSPLPPPSQHFFPQYQFNSLPNVTSGSSVDIFNTNAFKFGTYFTQVNIAPQGGVHANGTSSSSNTVAAWIEVGLTITNQINYLQFDAGFTDTNYAEGLLTVYWNTNQIGLVDERVAGTGMQTYQFALPQTESTGVDILSFRLDSFNGTTSSLVVSNVSTGYIGITEPLTLGVSLTNNMPLLQLTGASNYNYLVQSSTNLVNWTPMAYLPNSSGTILFFDTPSTNSPTRFYRAVMP